MTTAQSLFDTMVNGLASQGFRQSLTHDNRCVYRSPDGLKCAVGHLIPDEKYHPGMDDLDDYWLEDVMSDIELDPKFLPLLNETRAAHDAYGGPESMKEGLRRIAEKFQLQVPEVLND